MTEEVDLFALVGGNPDGLRWDGKPYGYRETPETRAAAKRAMEEALDLASPNRADRRAQILAWRGRRGSQIIEHGHNWWYKPGRRFCTNTPNRAGVPIPERYTDGGVIRVAEKLDAECVPDTMEPEQIPAFLALRQIVISVYRSAQKRAREAELPFTLTLFAAEELLIRQKMCCSISGIPFRSDRATDGFRAPFRPSLDRIVNSKGYVPGNVRLVLTIVNLAMNDWGDGPLIEIARAIAAKHPLPPIREE